MKLCRSKLSTARLNNNDGEKNCYYKNGAGRYSVSPSTARVIKTWQKLLTAVIIMRQHLFSAEGYET